MRTTAVAAAAVVLLAAGCATASTSGAPTGAEPSAETVAILVTARTTSGRIGQNDDDVNCLWRDTAYVLRDGDGGVVATGDAESLLGSATIGGEPVQLGAVISQRPDYECELRFEIDAPVVEFYELEVTTREPMLGEFSATAVFDAAAVASGVVVEFE